MKTGEETELLVLSALDYGRILYARQNQCLEKCMRLLQEHGADVHAVNSQRFLLALYDGVVRAPLELEPIPGKRPSIESSAATRAHAVPLLSSSNDPLHASVPFFQGDGDRQGMRQAAPPAPREHAARGFDRSRPA